MAEARPLGELGGDGRGERAAGAVVVLGLNARRLEPQLALRIEQKIDRSRTLGVAALDEHGLGAEPLQLLGLGAHLLLAPCLVRPEETRRLGQVRGDDDGARDQDPLQARDRLLIEQNRAGRGDHHRIEHHEDAGEALQSLGDGLDDRRRRQHADLDRADLKVGRNGLHLRDHETRRHDMHALDAQRVLGSERGDRGRAVNAERGEGLEVGLDAGPAPRIGARDGECDRCHGATIGRLCERRKRCLSRSWQVPGKAGAARPKSGSWRW